MQTARVTNFAHNAGRRCRKKCGSVDPVVIASVRAPQNTRQPFDCRKQRVLRAPALRLSIPVSMRH